MLGIRQAFGYTPGVRRAPPDDPVGQLGAIPGWHGRARRAAGGLALGAAGLARVGTRMAGAVDMKKVLDLARQGKLPLPDFMFDIEDMAEGSDTFTSELVSPLVVFLCPAAAHVNGRDFIVGGGEISLVSLLEKRRSVFTGAAGSRKSCKSCCRESWCAVW